MYHVNEKHSQSKSGGMLIAGIVLLLIAAAVGFYFYSDVFKTKVDEAARQAREWTPENIQKDPVGYLTWAGAECDKSSDALLARQISVNIKINEAKRTITANEAEIKLFQQLLDEAKSVYRMAAEENKWPADLRGARLTEEQLKRKVVESFQRVERDTQVTDAYKTSLAGFERQAAEIQQKLDEISALKHKLSTDLEVAKVKQTTEGLDGIAARINSIVDTSSAVVSQTSEPSIDDLAKPSPETKVNDTFDAIMKM